MDLAQPDKDALEAVVSWFGGIRNWFGAFDWGSAPDWVAAVGTVGTLAMALWQQKRDRDRVAQLESRERRARVLGVVVEVEERETARVYPFRGGFVRSFVEVRVHNDSGRPIYHAALLDADIKLIGSVGTVQAGSVVGQWVPEGLRASPVTWLLFTDAEGDGWLASSLGEVFEAGTPDFETTFRIDPDPVTPQPGAPAPPAMPPEAAPPDQGAAS